MNEITSEVASVRENRFLKLNYTCKTEQVSYSIADYVGNIVQRDDYDCIVDNSISIETLPKGVYMLCIIDGDSLTKVRFMKHQ